MRRDIRRRLMVQVVLARNMVAEEVAAARPSNRSRGLPQAETRRNRMMMRMKGMLTSPMNRSSRKP